MDAEVVLEGLKHELEGSEDVDVQVVHQPFPVGLDVELVHLRVGRGRVGAAVLARVAVQPHLDVVEDVQVHVVLEVVHHPLDVEGFCQGVVEKGVVIVLGDPLEMRGAHELRDEERGHRLEGVGPLLESVHI